MSIYANTTPKFQLHVAYVHAMFRYVCVCVSLSSLYMLLYYFYTTLAIRVYVRLCMCVYINACTCALAWEFSSELSVVENNVQRI